LIRSGWSPLGCRSLRRLLRSWTAPGSVGSVGFALKLVTDRSIHDAIEQRHRYRRISQVLAPRLKVDVDDQSSAALAGSAVNHLQRSEGPAVQQIQFYIREWQLHFPFGLGPPRPASARPESPRPVQFWGQKPAVPQRPLVTALRPGYDQRGPCKEPPEDDDRRFGTYQPPTRERFTTENPIHADRLIRPPGI